ncbi:phosphoenolpyruvate carboxykinase (ATP), partial [Staphylococcus sp. SIMBA_130]
KLSYTRAMIQAALNGELDRIETITDPIFGLHIPSHCPGVPADVLQPKQTWENKENYDIKAKELATQFVKNFDKFSNVAEEIKKAGPNV